MRYAHVVSFEERLDTLPEPVRSPREKLLAALALHDEGVAMQRLKLARQHPESSAEELACALFSWLLREDEP